MASKGNEERITYYFNDKIIVTASVSAFKNDAIAAVGDFLAHNKVLLNDLWKLEYFALEFNS
jgi:hypothetical protein